MIFIKNFSLIIFLLIIQQSLCNAQPLGYELSTKSKKAAKLYEAATKAFDSYDYEGTISKLNKAVDVDPRFYEAYLLMGEVYVEKKQTNKAIEAFKKTISISPDCFPPIYLNLGNLEFNLGEYQDAKKYLNKYLKYRRNPEGLIEKAEFRIRCCDFALNAIKNPVAFKPINLGANINTKFREYFPCMTVDDNTLLFTRQIDDMSAQGKTQEDFFISKKKNGKWSESKNLGPPVNTILNEGAPTLSPDGNMIIFAACELYGDYGKNRKGYGSCDLFLTYRNGRFWSKPQNLGYSVNTNQWETQPSLSSDGRTLYFIRGTITKEGINNHDIYVTKYIDKGIWTNPRKLSNKINTPRVEESVFIHPDGRTLYFSSDGHPGMGGLDIFVSRMDENGEWQEPVNLGYPINTLKNENSLLVSGDGNIAIIASDREGGYGLLDLYYFNLPEQYKPIPLTYMKGVVYDKETNKKLRAKFELIELKTGKIIVESFSDPVGGDFLVSIPSDRDYALNVAKDGYLFYSDNFSMKGEYSDLKPYLKDIPLQPVKIGETVVLKNIFFDTDKYVLKPESKVELDKLVALLKNNPSMKIIIGGHTDNVGSVEDNLILSDNRAKAVYNNLVKHGIKAERLRWKGYGETKPIKTNKTPEGRAINRRTDFVVFEK